MQSYIEMQENNGYIHMLIKDYTLAHKNKRVIKLIWKC